jgi:hypothetical protein
MLTPGVPPAKRLFGPPDIDPWASSGVSAQGPAVSRYPVFFLAPPYRYQIGIVVPLSFSQDCIGAAGLLTPPLAPGSEPGAKGRGGRPFLCSFLLFAWAIMVIPAGKEASPLT